MSKVNNVMKPIANTTNVTSSCVGLIQAFDAWMGREHAINGTEGMCQGIHR